MTRLTTKITNNYIVPNNVENIQVKVLNKLGQLEDLEEALGIDLITFFKIRKHCHDRKPIFIKDKDEITKSSCRVELGYESVAVHIGDYGADIYLLKDYGKTWALTREELKTL